MGNRLVKLFTLVRLQYNGTLDKARLHSFQGWQQNTC